ncbi:hypothetical protein [Marivirga sp.]|uniref:hypothetical protein n=1 Tax=Marivirga sp. TaxID=2018662 RepID=UPI003DA761DD
MGFELKNGYRKVKLHCFSGEIEDLEYPIHLNFNKKEPLQYLDQKIQNNISFKLKSEKGELKYFQFYNATFDFREGHFVSVLTSEKSGFHRLLINHNTQRFWYPNKNPYSIGKEGLWEKYLILISIFSSCVFWTILLYYLILPYLKNHVYVNFIFWGIGSLLLIFIISKIYQFPKRSRNEYLYNNKIKPQLKKIGTKILDMMKQKLNTIKN